MRCHLPVAQKEFFENCPGNVQVRAEYYGEEEFVKTTRDSEFNLRPVYSS